LSIRKILDFLSLYQTFVLEREAIIGEPIDLVFSFFSDASNLEVLTPKWLKFKILTEFPIVMKRNVKIDYKLKLHGFPIKWRSGITAWEPPYRFVDEQINGPYIKWIHTHEFSESTKGILIKDRVEYQVLGGMFTNFLYVAKQLDRIFDYRKKKMEEFFNKT
jgi:ligand-binding SRPBCC domain-containing protein